MQIFPEIFKWASIVFLFFLSIILVVLLGIAILVAIDHYAYDTRSLPKARIEAQEQFMMICKDEGLDPNSFHGPSIEVNEKDAQYDFTWRRPNNEEIYVTVVYLPYYTVPYSMSTPLSLRLANERQKKLRAQGLIPQVN